MIAPMKKFYLFFTGDPSEFLREVQRAGIVEVHRLPDSLGFENIPVTWDNLQEISHRIEFLKSVLKRAEGKDFSGKIVITEEEEKSVIKEFPLDDTYQKFFQIIQEIERRKKIAEKLAAIKKELFLIRGLPVAPSELLSMKNFSFCLFSLPQKQKAPDNIDSFSVEKIKEGGLFLVVFPLEKKKEVVSKIEGMKGTIIDIRRWNRPPSEIMKKIEDVEERNRAELEKAMVIMQDIVPLKYKILVFSDYVNSLLRYFEAKQNTGISMFVQCIWGWIKEKDIPRMELLIERCLPDGYLYISEPDVKEEVPVALDNSRIIQPFEVVTDLYGRPVYTNIDPTPHLSIFFILCFAFCITDAAYGLILIVLSFILIRKFKYTTSIEKFFRLMFYSGIATLFMGAITGSWFGDILTRLPSGAFPVATLKKLIVLDPLKGGNDTFLFLGWALILGYIQILWGLCLNLLGSIRHYGLKRSGEALVILAIQVLVALLIISFIASWKEIIPVVGVLLAISFLYLMILKSTTQKGFFMKMFWAFYSTYNVMAGNLLGDVLSYSRLFGLGLTTAVLALVINEMVFISVSIPFIGYIVAAILFIVGHLADLVLTLFGGYVHTSRLQYLEFFTKFFEGGGRPFAPLKEPRQYTYIRSGES